MTLQLTVVAPAPVEEDCPAVLPITGWLHAREVEPLDYLHDTKFPGRVLYVEDKPFGRGIAVKTRSAVGTWCKLIIWKGHDDQVELTRLVDDNLTRDAEGR